MGKLLPEDEASYDFFATMTELECDTVWPAPLRHQVTASVSAWRLPRPPVVALFVAAYLGSFIVCERGYASAEVPSPFWLPDSVILAALLLAPRNQWWFFLAAISPVRLVVGSVPGTPLWFQLVTIANDTGKALLSAWLVQRLIGRRVRLETLNELLVFIGVAAVALPVLSTAAALPPRSALGDTAWNGTYQWFLGDSLTQIVVTPAILYWGMRSYRLVQARPGELLALGAGLAAALIFVFIVPGDVAHAPVLLYALVPFLVWAAVRLGPFGTSNAISLIAVVSMFGTVRGTGVFAGGSASVLSLQLFLMVAAVSQLSLAVVIAERAELLNRQRSMNAVLLQAQESERTRIARELHDDVVQQLAVLKIDLDLIAKNVHGPLASLAEEAAQSVVSAAKSLRNLTHSLHPASVHIRGLVPSLSQLADELSHNGPVTTLTHERVPEALQQNVTVAIFRIAQEALHNAAKHSRAEHVSVHLTGGAGTLTLTVIDDGVGFEMDAVMNRGLGLVSMTERAEGIGGTLSVKSSPRGTRLDIAVPLSTRENRADTVVAAG
jgi:signal transduction histidine kinase